jgi:hypothetical protein
VTAQEANQTVAATFTNTSFSVASAANAYIKAKGLTVYQQRGLAYFINTEIEQEFGGALVLSLSLFLC